MKLLSTAPFNPPLVDTPVTMMVLVRWAAGPMVPEQVSVNAVDIASGPTVSVPDVGRLPLQPSLAVQEVALVVDQLSTSVELTPTSVMVAENVSVDAVVGVGVCVIAGEAVSVTLGC